MDIILNEYDNHHRKLLSMINTIMIDDSDNVEDFVNNIKRIILMVIIY